MPESMSRIEAMSSHQERGSAMPNDRSRTKPRPKPKVLPEAPRTESSESPVDEEQDRHRLDTMA